MWSYLRFRLAMLSTCQCQGFGSRSGAHGGVRRPLTAISPPSLPGPPNHHSQSTLRPPLPPPHNHTLSHHHSSANSLNRNSLTNRRSQIHAPAPAPNDLATTPESVQLQDSWVLNSNVPLETRWVPSWPHAPPSCRTALSLGGGALVGWSPAYPVGRVGQVRLFAWWFHSGQQVDRYFFCSHVSPFNACLLSSIAPVYPTNRISITYFYTKAHGKHAYKGILTESCW